MAEVTARKRGKTWEYRFEGASINGKRKQYSKSGFKTKKEALIEGNNQFQKYNRSGSLVEPSDMSFNDYMDYFLKNYIHKEMKMNTIKLYTFLIEKRLKPRFGMYKLSSINSMACQEWLNSLSNEGLSFSTIKKCKSLMSIAFDKAVVPYGLIESNPMKLVYMPKPKVEEKKSPIL